jgi:SAM-dependent methyltransferase
MFLPSSAGTKTLNFQTWRGADLRRFPLWAQSPKMPYEENSFDVVTCVVSVDYLNKPLEVFKEVARVLRPGGKFIISQSNRCFPTKAIAIWLQTNDLEHTFIIGSYFHYSGAFKPAFAKDISPKGGLFPSDPMYIIQGEVNK